MWFLTQKFNLNPRKRQAIMGIVAVLTFTSTQVQAAGINAATPTTDTTVQTSQDLQTTAVTGLVVPVSLPKVLPVAADVAPSAVMHVTMTAYSSTPGQTDDSPFIAADGSHVYDGMVAANFLPFGTKIMIPELFGDKVFVVHDRMNKRFPDRMDVWMATTSSALKFGVKHSVEIEIIK